MSTVSFPLTNTEYVDTVITEKSGKTITGLTFQFTILDRASEPDVSAVWFTADVPEVISPSVMKFKILVGPTGTQNPGAGIWRIWAKITSPPEVIIIGSKSLLYIQ